MRERYFRMYEEIVFKRCYYMEHDLRAKKYYNVFSFCVTLISIVSVLIWSIAKTMPTLWALIIAAAQFAQVLIVRLPWPNQKIALKYLLPALDSLILEIDHSWLALDIHDYSDETIVELISNYDDKFKALENQFTSDVEFPERKSVIEKAQDRQRKYFASKYSYDE